MEIKVFNTPQTNFKALKSSQFKGLEYSAMRKFKAPIEKFNSIRDFYVWSANKCADLTKKNFGGRDASIQLKRKSMKEDWIHHLEKNSNLTTPIILLVLSSIFKELKDNNSDLPPVLDSDVFEKTIESTKTQLNSNRELLFDFKKLYVENLRKKLIGSADKWVIIPSKKADRANYRANLEKLKTLSPRTWCTKNDKAEDYLENCDIHIFYQKGSPELGVRIKDGKIYDIVGFENNGKIPLKYLAMVKNYIQEQNLTLGLEAQDQIESAEHLENTIQTIRADIGEAIDKNDVYRIMEYFGFKPETLENGSISIIGFMQPRQGNFSDLGINENKLFEKISEVRGNVSLRNCSAASLGNIKKIGGSINFNDSVVLDTGALEEVNGDIYLGVTQLKSATNLKKVGGTIYYRNKISSLEELKEAL